MANNIIYLGELIKAFEAAGITVERDTRTGYFNATRMVDSYNAAFGKKKRWQNFVRLDNTKEYIEALNEDLGGSSDLSYRGTGNAFEVVNGGNLAERQQGVWTHPLLALKFAGWLNVKLEIACNKIIMGIMDGTLIIQAPIYQGRDRKEVTIKANQPLQIMPYMSEDYLLGRKAEFGW